MKAFHYGGEIQQPQHHKQLPHADSLHDGSDKLEALKKQITHLKRTMA